MQKKSTIIDVNLFIISAISIKTYKLDKIRYYIKFRYIYNSIIAIYKLASIIGVLSFKKNILYLNTDKKKLRSFFSFSNLYLLNTLYESAKLSDSLILLSVNLYNVNK